MKNIGYCGINCSKCRIFIATVNNDINEKQKIAEEWSTDEYPLNKEDTNCDGCRSKGGNIISFCRDCDIRNCVTNRNIDSCFECVEFKCNMIKNVFKKTPEAENNLKKYFSKNV